MKVSAFTPSNTDPEVLEKILVQREPVLRQLIRRLQHAIRDKRPNHSLYVAPRGNGKTMLVTLVVHRLKKLTEMEDQFRIAWLGEDDRFSQLVDVASSIANRLATEYPGEFSPVDHQSLRKLDNEKKAEAIMKSVQEELGDRTMLLIMENLDRTLGSLNDNEQLQWRSMLQEMGCISMLATAQQLVDELRSRDEAFHGFFDTVHLTPLEFSDAVLLMTQIAQAQENDALAKFVQTPAGRHRARVIHHLAGGSHRLYVVLSEFLTAEKMDDLIELFETIAEPLATYYQERSRDLPAQQARIVQVMAEYSGALPVKEIATRTFIDERTCSKQLSELKSKGYVKSYRRGRASYYEIAEPLMRLSIDEKNRHGKPIRLVAQFIKAWFPTDRLNDASKEASAKVAAYCKIASAEPLGFITEVNRQIQEELYTAKRTGSASTERSLQDELLISSQLFGVETNPGEGFKQTERAPVEASSADSQASKDLRTRIFGDASARDIEEWFEHESELGDIIEDQKRSSLEKLVALQIRSWVYWRKGQHALALDDINHALANQELSPANIAELLVVRGIVHGSSDGSSKLAEADFSSVLSMDDAPLEQRAIALFNRGVTHGLDGDAECAIADYTALLEITEASVEQRADALLNRGISYGLGGNFKRSIADFTAMLEIPDTSAKQLASALLCRGIAHDQEKDLERAIADYTKVIEMPDSSSEQRAIALFSRGVAYGHTKDSARELADLTTLIEIPDPPAELRAAALLNRGFTYYQDGKYEHAIADCTALIDMSDAPNEKRASAVLNRGFTHHQKGDFERAIADYTTLIEMPDAPLAQRAVALFNRGVTYGQEGDSERELVDYTAVLKMSEAPVEERAKALFNRGITYGQEGNSELEIADYTTLLEMHDAPEELRCSAFQFRVDLNIAQGCLLSALDDLSTFLDSIKGNTKSRITALTTRMAVLRKLDRESESTADVAEINRLVANDAGLHHLYLWNLGCTQWRLDEFAPAVESFEEAIEYAVTERLDTTDSRFGLLDPLLMTASFRNFLDRLAEAFELGNREDADYGGAPKDLLATLLYRPHDDWPRYASAIAKAFCEHGKGADLGRGLLLTVRTMLDREVSEANMERWGDAWAPLASQHPELQIPVESLQACISAIKSRSDRPLFKVSVEIRRLIRPLLNSVLGEPELE